MTHPTVADRAAEKQAEWRCTQDEAAELIDESRPGGVVWLNGELVIRDLLAAALWLVDHTFSTSDCGTTLAREGDIQDLTAAVERLRKVGA